MILLEGTLGQPKNGKEAVNLLKRAAGLADESTPYALHELAILYEGVNLDPSTGIVPVCISSLSFFFSFQQRVIVASQSSSLTNLLSFSSVKGSHLLV